jgi:predicted PolB exonuclease-like 3'-5' exonuclease
MITHKKVVATHFHKTLIIDIETVPLQYDWNMMPDALQDHWLRKLNLLRLTDEERHDPEQQFRDRAGIYAEFGKIVCIGLGYVYEQDGASKVRLKSIANDDEKLLLEEFLQTLRVFGEQHRDITLAGHNIKEFDIPYICRRLTINGLELPACMDLAGLKPWQVHHQDTLELWRFGDYKNYTSLDLLAYVLGVPSSKSDIDGSKVSQVYWEEKNLDRIAQYCLRDVYTTALVYLRLKGWTESLPEACYV